MFSVWSIIGQIVGWLGLLTSVYVIYFVMLAVWGEVRRKRTVRAAARQPVTRFAVVVPSRNEEAVIGNLLHTMRQQNYPSALYTIYVAPNNCTDNTREIALAQGAQIFDPHGEIRSKGEVLAQFVEQFMDDPRFDAICVFDADNMVHADFLQHMNEARLAGAHIAQGFKDSKNPFDNIISLGCSMYFWMLDRFYNAGRETLQLSSFVAGTGYMVTTEFLRRIGGWNTKTMTEDYEFTAQCVLAGERVHYIPAAIVYDEQPLTFGQSWKQRRRWSTGAFESARYYLPALLKQAVFRKCRASFDVALAYMGPFMFVLSFIALSGQAAIRINGGLSAAFLVPHLQTGAAALTALTLLFVLLGVCGAYAGRGRALRGVAKGACAFALLLLSWAVINMVTLVKKQRRWDAIAHTRSMTIGDEPRRTVSENGD